MEMVVMDVCPTEDAVTAFMDYFLQPLLPVKSTKQHKPTHAQQEAVAKQVHAVVILYNHFHRKKHPQLEFLDFEPFCELMTILKPQMLAYMKFMQLSKDNESKEKEISLTEKCVMNACCICEHLDIVQDLPTLETLPVCKVAVMLVDAEGDNCYLQFSSITKGAWSLIEKEVDPVMLMGNDSEISRQLKGIYTNEGATRKNMNMIYLDGQFQKIALSAITEAIDINQANIKIVESHLVSSLNKENAAVRFFILKYTKSFSEDITLIPIKFVVDSLRGPLVKKDCISWSITEAAEYFHMFPYAAIMSAWLSRDLTSTEVENTASVSNVQNADKSHVEMEASKTPAVADDSDGHTTASSSAVYVSTEVNTRGSSKSSMLNTTMVLDNIYCNDSRKNAKEKTVPDINSAKNLQIGDARCASIEKNSNHSQRNNIRVKEDVVITKFHGNTSDLNIVVENACNNDPVAYDCGASHKDSSVVPQLSETKYIVHAIASSGNMLTQSALKVLLRKREKLSQQRREIEEEIAQCDKTILSILSGKEEGLAAKLESLMEACNDMNLTSPVPVPVPVPVTVPVESLEVVLPRLDNQASPTPVPAKRKRASDLSPNVQKPCKELDEICHENNWGIPNYRLSQLRGGFQSVVTVERSGFEVSEKGEIYSNVFEARESAAKHMLFKLRNMNAKA